MPDAKSLSERMADAARDLQNQDDPQRTLDAAVRLAVSNVSGAHAAAISLVERRERIETIAYTDDYAVKADHMQYDLREGPCLDAIWVERIVHSPDLRTETRWTTWAPRVVEELGVGSMLCFQLFTIHDTVGGLNLYSREPRAFDERGRDDGLALAAHIAVAVVSAKKIQQLEAAVESRTIIGEAIGMMMERFGLSSERAFGLLTRLSSDSNTKVREIAEQIVTTRELPGSAGKDS